MFSSHTTSRSIALILFIFAWGFAPPAAEPPLIKATRTEILFTLPSDIAPNGPVAVYELAPNEPDDAWRSKKPVLVARPRGQGARAIALPRFERSERGGRDRIYSKFVLAPAGNPDAPPIVPARFVEDMSEAAARRMKFPASPSKKGLQVKMIDDAVRLGVKHSTVNVLVPLLIAWDHRPDDILYEMDGETFHFDRGAIRRLDHRIKALSDAGMIVSLVLLDLYITAGAPSNRVMIHPRFDPACPNHYSAFNTVTDEGLKYFKASIEFLVARYTRPDRKFGRALNYIVGNEVNSHWWWTNMGRVAMEDFLEDYLRTVRIASTAARKICSAARVYISLDHHWTIFFGKDDTKAFAAKPFLDRFARRAREQGDFPWNLAYHAYPESLWDPRTWLDKDATDSFDAPMITFRNIELLPAYFRRPALLYRGRPRHIILSEQGFHVPKGEDGEILQAAGFCYAYYKVAHLEGIDSFILYRHVDSKAEPAGLRFGLWARVETPSGETLRKRKIYDVFRLADSPRWREAFAFAKPIIGIERWEELLPEPEKNRAKSE